MRIALVNSVILNGGDAGIIYGTVDAIKSVLPAAEVVVYAHAAAAAGRYYPDLNIAPMPFETWPRSRIARESMRATFSLRNSLHLRTAGEGEFLRRIAGSDAVVYCGGGYISDSYRLKLTFDIMDATLSTGVPHMAYGHSIGPIRRAASVRRAQRIFNRFEIVTVRDEASLNVLERIGVSRKRVEYLADAAIALRTETGNTLSAEDSAAIAKIDEFKSKRKSPLVFFSVRKWRFPGSTDAALLSENLHGQLRALVRAILLQTDWSVCFVSTCQGRAEYAYDDSAVASRIVDELDELDEPDSDRVMVSAHAFHPRTYPYLIGRCADLVIGMRMHLTIFSLLAGVPFIALAYEQKSIELCRRLGVEKNCHPVDKLEALAALQSAIAAYENRRTLRASLLESRDALAKLSMQNAVLLADRLRA